MSPTSSWLFIRDNKSIWIERPYGFALVVAGPGTELAHLIFQNEAALEAYQVTTAERLAGEGWFLWAFDPERRQRDRRSMERTTADRRRPLAATA